MSDNLVLYGPGGASPVNLGSWLQADPGPDYGARGLIQAIEAEAFGDGGAFAYERAAIRHMSFPLILASGGAGLSLTQLESVIRMNARTGGYLDVQTDGTPSAESVRFDILHGRWEPAYSIPINRAARRPGSLYLDTQPYGYWPTTILLASQAPTGPFPLISWNPASVIGDGPGLFELNFAASIASYFGGNWVPDGIFWSLGRASAGAIATPFIAASMLNLATGWYGQSSLIGTVASDGYAPLGANFRISLPSMFWGSWLNIAQFGIAHTGSAYPGRYRALAYLRAGPSALPFQVSLDETHFTLKNFRPLASSYPVATVLPQGAGSWADAATGIFQIVDLGEHQVPPVGSGLTGEAINSTFRLWARIPTTNLSIATYPRLDLAGVYMLPADGDHGYLSGGFNQPSYWVANGNGLQMAGFQVDSINERISLAAANSNDGAATQWELMEPLFDARLYHYGGLPQTGTQMALEGVVFSRLGQAGATAVRAWGGPCVVGMSARYRPRFQFLKGL